MRERLEEFAGALGVVDHAVEVVRMAAGFQSLQFHSDTNVRVLPRKTTGDQSFARNAFSTNCARSSPVAEASSFFTNAPNRPQKNSSPG